MPISEDQRIDRRKRLGSSDARRLMAGDWRSLWLEKTGRVVPDPLDFVPAVQIGIVTEVLHPRFWERRTGISVLPGPQRTWTHPKHPWLGCHPDFLTWRASPATPDVPPDCILEAKFSAAPKDDKELAAFYFWQLQHQMLVTGLDHAALSILRPSSYSAVPMAADPDRQALLLETAAAFWWHVENDVEPADPDAQAPPDPETAPVLDMSGHNAFVDQARTLLRTRADWAAYRAAETELKALMPQDAGAAFVPGDGLDPAVALTRSRDGRLILRFGPPARRLAERARPWRSEDP